MVRILSLQNQLLNKYITILLPWSLAQVFKNNITWELICAYWLLNITSEITTCRTFSIVMYRLHIGLFVGCLQCHQYLYACLGYIALFVWLGLFMIDNFAIGIFVFFGFTCLMLTIYDQTVFLASFYQFLMSNMLCVCLRKESNIKKNLGQNPTTSRYGECRWATREHMH